MAQGLNKFILVVLILSFQNGFSQLEKNVSNHDDYKNRNQFEKFQKRRTVIGGWQINTLKTGAYREISHHVTSDIDVYYYDKLGENTYKYNYGPGLRIKTITTNDGINSANMITHYKYQMYTDIDRSSGHLLSSPSYFYQTAYKKPFISAGGGVGGGFVQIL